jgi:molecular chaperone Hsp33
MASFREEGEKTQVTWRGDGPLGSIQVIADAMGVVKGKVGNPGCNPPLRQDGKFNVGGAVGRGVLAVVRSLPFTKEGWQTPYTGMTAIKTGEIAEDLAEYMLESEQTQCAMGLGVSIGRDLEVNAAGGFLVQVLPFAEEETLSQLEKNIVEAGSVSSMLREGLSARDITEKILNGLGVSDTGFTLTPMYGPCEASALRDRMASAVATLGEEEVKSILEEQGKIEVTCEFCRDTYNFEEKEIMDMVRAAEK